MNFGQSFKATLLLLAVLTTGSSAEDKDWKEKYPPGFKAEGSLIEGESDKPYYADFWRLYLEKTKHPTAALMAADKFYDSIPFEKRTPHRDKIRIEFIRAYFFGFTNPTGSMTGGEKGAVEGCKAGQEYRRNNPKLLTAVMKDFGYTPIQADGIWTVSFEHNGFKPNDRKKETEWWLSSIGNIESDLPKGYQIPDDGVMINIQGYLSAEGNYGHLGAYKREVFVSKITRTKTEPTPPNETIKPTLR